MKHFAEVMEIDEAMYMRCLSVGQKGGDQQQAVSHVHFGAGVAWNRTELDNNWSVAA